MNNSKNLSDRRHVQIPIIRSNLRKDLEKNLIDDEWNDITVKEPTPIKRITDQIQEKIEKFLSWLK